MASIVANAPVAAMQCKSSLIAQGGRAAASRAGPRPAHLSMHSSVAGTKLQAKAAPATSRRAAAGRVFASAEASKGA